MPVIGNGSNPTPTNNPYPAPEASSPSSSALFLDAEVPKRSFAELSAFTNQAFLPLVIIPPAPVAPRSTASYYMKTTDVAVAEALGRELGNLDKDLPGRQQSIVILLYGEPRYENGDWGTTLYDNDLSFATTSNIQLSLQGFARGYSEAVYPDIQSQVIVLAGTTNSGSAVTDLHGSAWATMVNDFQNYLRDQYYGTRVVAGGANDIEMLFSTFDQVKPWLDSYMQTAVNHSFYYIGDAGGCPTDAHGATLLCDNSWTQHDIWMTAWGDPEVSISVPLPQIYNTNSLQAYQWYHLVKYGIEDYSQQMILQGALTQWEACNQKEPEQPCHPTVRNTPEDAWTQLRQVFYQDLTTYQNFPYLTDIRYGRLYP